jgi:D-serine deaminase-like pyridoxal phosphate-dependent protein
MIMVDSVKHCDALTSAGAGRTIKVCMEVDDASLRIGPAHVGVRRSRVHTATEAYARLHLVQGDQIVDDVPTYRGEGRNFE